MPPIPPSGPPEFRVLGVKDQAISIAEGPA
jgi:hypothetical protein